MKSLTWLATGIVAALLSGCTTAATSGAKTSPISPTPPANPTSGPLQTSSTPPMSESPAISATPSEAPTKQGFAAVGKASFETEKGYTFDVSIDWAADYPRSDVGSNPPGKTNIIIKSQKPFVGTFRNTTVGGRGFPVGMGTWMSVVGIYDARSTVCSDKATRDQLFLGDIADNTKSATTCLVPFQPILGFFSSGGIFDRSVIPNGETLTFGSLDVGGLPEDRVWKGLAEPVAEKWIAELPKPRGIALLGQSMKVTSSEKTCTYTNQNWDTKMQYAALLSGSC